MIATLLQLQWMTLRGRAIRSFRLLKQPKYLVGAVAGFGWLMFWVGRPILNSGIDLDNVNVVVGLPLEQIAHEALPGLHLVVGVVVTVFLVLPWLYPFGRLGLGFREAELTMLLQAPLTRRQVIGYGLLKSLFGIVLTAAAFTLILGFGGPAARAQTFLALLTLFVFWDLNSKWRGLFLLRQQELPPRTAWVRRIVLTAGLTAYLALVVLLFLRFQWAFLSGLRGPDFEAVAGALLERIADTPLPELLSVLALPGRLMTAPLFAGGLAAFGMALLPMAVLIVVQRELVVRHPAHFEESALERAKADETKKSPTRRFKKLSNRARTRMPFALGVAGRPELAIVWKNLMRVSRVPLLQLMLGVVASFAVVAAVPIVFDWPEIPYFVMSLAGVVMLIAPPVVVGMAWNNDLRTEFGHIELLRTWPVRPERFVLAQVAAPASLSFVVATLGATLILTAWFASRIIELRTGVPSEVRLFPDGAMGVSPTLGLLLLLAGVLPLSAGGAFMSSAMQNLAILFVPAWMAESVEGSKGIAAFGRRLVFGLGVFLAYGIAMVPSAVLVAAVILLQRLAGVPWSAWAFPVWGLLAAAPLFVGAWLVVRLAGRLWRDLDPSEEVLEIGA